MKQRNRRIVLFLLAVVILALCAGSFFLGKHLESEKASEERELGVQINRSELDGLGAVDGTIYITGHRSPDTDTVSSSVAYASLLRALGYDAVPAVLGEISPETKYVLERAGLDAPELLIDASGKNIILVDHSEPAQSADGLGDARILGIIDHHGVGGVTTGNQLIYDARPLGATATVIWLRYRSYGIEPDPKTAAAMAGAILSDTGNLQADTVTFADQKALEILCGIAGITDPDAFYREMYKASVSYEGMTDEEIFYSDYKEYESGGTKFSIAYVAAYDEADARDKARRMKEVLPSTLRPTGMDLAFAQISIFHDGISVSFLIPCGEAEDEILSAAFGDRAESDGTSYRLEPGISRKQVLVPAITDLLSAYPKE